MILNFYDILVVFSQIFILIILTNITSLFLINKACYYLHQVSMICYIR